MNIFYKFMWDSPHPPLPPASRDEYIFMVLERDGNRRTFQKWVKNYVKIIYAVNYKFLINQTTTRPSLWMYYYCNDVLNITHSCCLSSEKKVRENIKFILCGFDVNFNGEREREKRRATNNVILDKSLTYRSTFNGNSFGQFVCVFREVFCWNSYVVSLVIFIFIYFFGKKQFSLFVQKYRLMKFLFSLLPLICVIVNKKAKVIWGILFATDMRCPAWIHCC